MTYTARQQRLIEEVVASRASGPHRRVLETVLVPHHVTVLGTERDVVAILSAIADPATGDTTHWAVSTTAEGFVQGSGGTHDNYEAALEDFRGRVGDDCFVQDALF